MKNIRVVHINTSLVGGAALCAQRIAEATKRKGVETSILICEGDAHGNIHKATLEKCIWDSFWPLKMIKSLMRRLGFVIDEKYLVRRIEKRLCKNQQELYFHVPLSSYRNLPNHPLIQEADIVHLHWVSGMIDYPTFFKSIEKPIVWTMHDKHPLTGISHYLSKFNQVPDCVKDLDKKCVTIKEKSLCLTKNLHLVAISQMMEKLCQESIITKKIPRPSYPQWC